MDIYIYRRYTYEFKNHRSDFARPTHSSTLSIRNHALRPSAGLPRRVVADPNNASTPPDATDHPTVILVNLVNWLVTTVMAQVPVINGVITCYKL